MDNLRVLIVADDPLARAGLAALLQNESGLTVVGQASSDTTMLDAFSHEVALLDMGWELDDDLAEMALLELDQPLVVLIPDDEYIAAIMSALNGDMRTAAYGVLVRNAPPTRLVAALNAAATGLVTLDPKFAQSLSPAPQVADMAGDTYDPLTPREQEVLDLLAEGLPNKTIAAQLHISEYTVKFHVNSILTKLGAGSRTEAVVRAMRLGLTSL